MSAVPLVRINLNSYGNSRQLPPPCKLELATLQLWFMSRNLQLSFSSKIARARLPFTCFQVASPSLCRWCHPSTCCPAWGAQGSGCPGSIQREVFRGTRDIKPQLPQAVPCVLRTSVLRRVNPNLRSQPRPIPGISRRPASLPRHAIQVLPGRLRLMLILLLLPCCNSYCRLYSEP